VRLDTLTEKLHIAKERVTVYRWDRSLRDRGVEIITRSNVFRFNTETTERPFEQELPHRNYTSWSMCQWIGSSPPLPGFGSACAEVSSAWRSITRCFASQPTREERGQRVGRLLPGASGVATQNPQPQPIPTLG